MPPPLLLLRTLAAPLNLIYGATHTAEFTAAIPLGRKEVKIWISTLKFFITPHPEWR